MKHLEKIKKILGGNLHGNPSRMTTLAALRYRRQPQVLRNLRNESPDNQTLEEAIAFLEAETGERQEREAVLAIVAEHITSFQNPEESIVWIIRKDHRLGVWCIAQVAKWALEFVRPSGRRAGKAVNKAKYNINIAEQWVRNEIDSKRAVIETTGIERIAASAYDATVFDASFAAFSAPSPDLFDPKKKDSTAKMLISSAAQVPGFTRDPDFQSPNWQERINLAKQRITQVIVDAILKFPEIRKTLQENPYADEQFLEVLRRLGLPERYIELAREASVAELNVSIADPKVRSYRYRSREDREQIKNDTFRLPVEFRICVGSLDQLDEELIKALKEARFITHGPAVNPFGMCWASKGFPGGTAPTLIDKEPKPIASPVPKKRNQ